MRGALRPRRTRRAIGRTLIWIVTGVLGLILLYRAALRGVAIYTHPERLRDRLLRTEP